MTASAEGSMKGGERAPRLAAPPYSFHENGIEFEDEYTLAQWVEAARQVQRESVGRQWRVGDLVNAERWQECSQYIEEIDYPVETQANYGRIAAAYKREERRSLSWAHHRAVYKHEGRLSLLDAAIENGWSAKELKAQAYPEKRIRRRRYSIEELREAASEWADLGWDGAADDEVTVNHFFLWLASRESPQETREDT